MKSVFPTFSFVGILILLVLGIAFIINSRVVHAQIALDPEYCDGDYYKIPGEDRCSRAPNACGNGYDELNTSSKMPNPQSCMGDGDAGRAEKGCAGYVPACCYEVARTGDYTKCIGYWERLWCAPVQCDQAQANGASDSQCGGSCQCGHAFGSYCGSETQPVPLEQRLGVAVTPTSTPPVGSGTPTPTSPAGSDPTPTTSNQETCEQKKAKGDYDCNNAVNEADFTAWKTDFVNGAATLSQFEYWRRAAY